MSSKVDLSPRAAQQPDRQAGPDRTPLRADALGRWALAVLGVVVALSVVRAFQPMTYAGDIWRQSDTATIARNFAENGMNLFFPQINWGGAGPGYVETEFPLMPWLSAALYPIFGEHEAVGRLLSLAFMLVAAAAFWALAKRLLAPRAARWALIAFAVSPAFMRYGTAFMPEATVLAFYLLALLAFHRWLAQDRGIWLAATAVAASMAALVKPTSLHLGLVLLLWTLLVARDRLRRPSVYVAAGLALVAPALWLWHARGLYQTYGNTFGVLSGGDDKFGSLSLWLSPAFYLGNLRTEVIFIYGVVGVPFAALAVWRFWRHPGPARTRFLLVAGFAALVVYYFAVGRYSSSDAGIQYHLFSLPFAAILVGVGLEWAHRWWSARQLPRVVVGLAVLVLAAQSLNVFVQSTGDRSGKYGSCATALDQVSAPQDLVVIASSEPSQVAGVPNNWQEPVIFHMADRRGWSMPTDRQDPALLTADRKAGARFFVSYQPQRGGALQYWLIGHATQVRSIAADGCDVWALTRSR